MRLLCCITTFNRPEYTVKTIDSWRETRHKGDVLIVVDNASTERYKPDWSDEDVGWRRNERNLFPGAATNIGWHEGLAHAKKWNYTYDLLQRSDNDIEYLPGWRDEVEAAFEHHPTLGQLGVLNLWEDYGGHQPVNPWQENGHTLNVDQFTGGNCVIRRELWDAGLRWQSGPWRPGPNEDTQMTLDIQAMGYWCARVIPTIANNQSFHRYEDYPSYYQETARLRGLVPELSV